MAGFGWRLEQTIDRLVAATVRPSRAIVLSGFPRSGTTWIQQSVASAVRGKTIFEPFHPRIPAMARIMAEAGWRPDSASAAAWFMPYATPAGPVPRHLEATIRRALVGGLAGGRAYRLRTSWTDSARRTTVVKMVRGALCLTWVRSRFGCPTIHVHRDPRGVAASVRRSPALTPMEGVTLAALLLGPDDGRRAWFATHTDLIEEADRGTPFQRIVAYWALTELHLRDGCRDAAGGPLLVAYEDLLRGGAAALEDVLLRAGVDVVDPSGIERDSAMTAPDRRGATPRARTRGWERELDAADVRAVEAIVRRVGLEERLREAHANGD